MREILSRIADRRKIASRIIKYTEDIDKTRKRVASPCNPGSFALTPAEEWIRDNGHVIDKARESLKEMEFFPERLFNMAEKICDKYECRPCSDDIYNEIAEYQQYGENRKKGYFKTKELDHLKSLVVLALLEKLSEVSKEAVKVDKERKEAEDVFRRFMKYMESSQQDSNSRAMDIWLSSIGELTPVFAETILLLSARKSGDTRELRRLLQRKLAGRGITLDRLISYEHSQRMNLGILTGNIISTLRNIDAIDWVSLTGRLSGVERIYMEDPCGIYPKMTKKSRAEYVRLTEKLAPKFKLTPEALALECKEACGSGEHIGKYLLAKSREKESGRGLFVVLVLLAAVCISIIPGLFFFKNLLLKIVFSVLIFVPALNFSSALGQKIMTKRIPPRLLPEIDIGKNIPGECSVMVIIPALLTDPKRIRELFGQLEIFYHGNKDENIYFALVGDFKESNEAVNSDDKEILEAGIKESQKLNFKYGNKFFFFYRERVWQESRHKWMGWERKRGAVIQFNSFILGCPSDIKPATDCNIPNISYVFTVDADTIIPTGAVHRMVGIMAHPLNKPVLGRDDHIIEGYGILAPVTKPSEPREGQSLFQEIFSGKTGPDPYDVRSSDFYFDIWDRGIYTGKGMYDPAVFNTVIKDFFPEDSILSHDLAEGELLKTAVATDICIYDSFPKNYESYTNRLHRWIRGDWQLVPYCKAYITDSNGLRKKNIYKRIKGSEYKIIMNFIRSSTPIFVFIILFAGFIFMPGLWGIWVIVLSMYALLPFFLSPGLKNFLLGFFHAASLPYDAYVSFDGISRSLYRVCISRKNLLEWVTSRDAENLSGNTLAGYIGRMWFALLSGIVFLWLQNWALAALWLSSPFLMAFISIKKSDEGVAKGIQREEEYRMLCYRIYGFYRDYATESDNFLPPDNVQFTPVYSVAHRTSPTNIGFYILSTVIAYMMGFITLNETVRRLEDNYTTLMKMEKYRGHLFNWYDTVNILPLKPIFISTVDSGNLCACMLAGAELLRKSIIEDPEEEMRRLVRGLITGVNVLNSEGEADSRIDILPLQNLLACDDPEQQFSSTVTSLNKEVGTGSKTSKDAIWREGLRNHINNMLEPGENVQNRCYDIADKLEAFALSMDFSFLYNESKGVFSTGFNMEEEKLSESCYDMLMSEARLTGYIAMAKGDIPPDHYSKLSGKRGNRGKGIILSWSGTAFEYMLPEIFLDSFNNSVWRKTVNMAVRIQMDHGRKMGYPWGISESGYNVMDPNMNYKYKAFGVPAMAVDKGNEFEYVVAPYGVTMMLDTDLHYKVYDNLEDIKNIGGWGIYGYYEAIDCTKGRNGIVASYMAHHMGMSMAACGNYLLDNIIKKTFSSRPEMASCQILLSMKGPRGYGRYSGDAFISGNRGRIENLANEEGNPEEDVREISSLRGENMPWHVLSNGEYRVVNNANGGGYSAWRDIYITRWRGGFHQEEKGVRIYVKAPEENKIYMPFEARDAENSRWTTFFRPEESEFCAVNGEVEVSEHICVSPEENSEIRHIIIKNSGKKEVLLEIAAFTEIMLSGIGEYCAHPAYSDLFITTSYNGEGILFAGRQPRDPAENQVWASFSIEVPEYREGAIQYDTELGGVFPRQKEKAQWPLFTSGTGTVITPCFALGCRLRIPPGVGEVFISMNTGNSYEQVCLLGRKFQSKRNCERAFELARTRSLIEKEHTGIYRGEGKYFLGLINRIILPLKVSAWGTEGVNKTKALEYLHSLGLSGRNPIITVMMRRKENSEALEKMVRMWCFYSFRGIKVDLAVVVFDNGEYISPLRDLADRLSAKALSGCFPFRGEIYVIVCPGDREGAREEIKGLLSCSNMIFWL